MKDGVKYIPTTPPLRSNRPPLATAAYRQCLLVPLFIWYIKFERRQLAHTGRSCLATTQPVRSS